jgi:hypothetical protein
LAVRCSFREEKALTGVGADGLPLSVTSLNVLKTAEPGDLLYTEVASVAGDEMACLVALVHGTDTMPLMFPR